MAFKSMEERFLANMTEMYKGTARVNGSEQPYLEIKPNDPNARETANDTQFLPIGSVKRDLKRIGKFSKSNAGLLFLGKQQILQTGNAFSETRLLNPLFVIGNVVPYIHLRRPLTVANSFTLQSVKKSIMTAITGNGDSDAEISPASTDPRIGRAGRLQIETAKKSTQLVMGTGTKDGLLGLLSPLKLVSTLVGLLSLKDQGTLGVNERPELSVDGKGEYYSIAMWKGTTRKNNSVSGNLSSAILSLRKGNIKGAISNVASAAKTFLFGKAGQGRNAARTGRLNGADHRYFITNATERDGYFDVDITTGTPDEIISAHAFLDRNPYLLDSAAAPPKLFDKALRPTKGTSKGFDISSAFKKAKQDIKKAAKKALKKFVSNFVSESFPESIKKLLGNSASDDSSSNTAQDKLLFDKSSLAVQYEEDERLAFIRDTLQLQKDTMIEYWKNKPMRKGFASEGYVPTGEEQSVNYRKRSGKTRYLSDNLNAISVIEDGPGETQTSAQTITELRALGDDLIDVRFFDFVNSATIPFRAFISGLNETISPNYQDTPYIGRIERNIVYINVTREIGFTLHIQAFNDKEMARIYRKMNYLTGLCYPAKYDNGFIVPPLVKLTIGDLHRDQPGYLRSLQYTVDDNIAWETIPSFQAPHGMSVNISYSVIEKAQMDTNGVFYTFGTTRNNPSSYKHPDFPNSQLVEFDAETG